MSPNEHTSLYSVSCTWMPAHNKGGFFFCVSQILVQSPGTVVVPGFPESKFRPVVLVRKSSFLHIVQLSLTVTVKSVWISLHKHQLSGTEEKKTPAVLCGSLSQKQSPLSELKPPHGVRGQSARSLQRNALQEAGSNNHFRHFGSTRGQKKTSLTDYCFYDRGETLKFISI